MALVLKDRVKETTTTAGTGTITLAGAAAGFQSFAAVGNGNQTFYAIVDAVTGDWEVGVGTYTASGTTLSRTTVVSSSNAGSLVPFAAGTKDVFVTYPSSRAVYLDAAGSAVTALDIGTLGTSTANITTANITSGTITTPPTNNTDIVNKQYADAIATGIHFHEAVGYATTAALPAATYNNGTGGVGATLTGNANGALTVDGYTFTSPADNGTRILIKNQSNGAENGVYTLTQAGNSSPGAPFILTRSTDMDSVGTGVDQIDEGDFFLVTSGTANANTAWVQQTPPPITIGTTAIIFQQFSAPITYTAGTGLSESPSFTFNIANIGTAGTYGSASSVPVITTNAQGQVTGVTPTAIAISGAAVSGNISGSAGSVANALTAGTFLTSGGTFDGSAARTFAVDATSANTASKVVARDASGNFSAGTITATLSGSATSATTATNLAGGAANQLAVQTGSGATGFVPAPTASGQTVTWNGSSIDWAAGPVAGITYLLVSANYTAANREGVLTNTSGGSFTVTLPASPATGAQVIVADAGPSWGTNNLTVGRNGATIGGLAEDLVCDITGASVQLVYDGSTWEVYAQIGGNGGNAVTLAGVQTLTNKTIAFGSNTLTDVAGTTATQTLTNKTLTNPIISLGGTNGTTGQALVSQGTGVAPAWATVGSELIRVARTSNTALSSANKGNLIDITSGTFTQTFDSCSSLGNGWFCYIDNSGTGNITLDPSGSETIDGLASYIMYPGEVRLVQCDGTTLRTVVLNSFYLTFTTSGTFTKPPGYLAFGVDAVAGGGSGAKDGFATGGAGGAGVIGDYAASLFGTTTTITVGSGGAAVSTANTAGSNGGNTTVGSLVTAYGGRGGIYDASRFFVVTNTSALITAITGINDAFDSARFSVAQQSGVGSPLQGGNTGWGGGGGSGFAGGASGGVSAVHGAGGGLGNAGVAPGGGGGASSGGNSGAGARGEVRIWGIV